MITAKQSGLISCDICHQLNPQQSPCSGCARCGSPISYRKLDSIARTWAFLIAAIIVFIPANLLPIMTVTSFGDGSPDTIISGIMLLLKMGMIPVAILVFFASFLVPLAKIFGLAILLLSVQRGSSIKPKHRVMLYRLVQLLGKWSMLDVFVVALMATIVQLGFISEIVPGAGVNAFAVMVLLTMLAAHAFDPRLIWDKAESDG